MKATSKLFVNLSASQTRKRLKGHGGGVKSVEATGRNQTMIVHTATGDHLHDLESLFADVVSSECRDDLDTPIENLRNLGPSSASCLRRVGIHTRADLEEFGPILAYQLVKREQPDMSLNLLWAMFAALTDRDWRELSAGENDQLKAQLE